MLRDKAYRNGLNHTLIIEICKQYSKWIALTKDSLNNQLSIFYSDFCCFPHDILNLIVVICNDYRIFHIVFPIPS
nr:MAG TPA: hypothetical protein [Caudoviricetes sp.]